MSKTFKRKIKCGQCRRLLSEQHVREAVETTGLYLDEDGVKNNVYFCNSNCMMRYIANSGLCCGGCDCDQIVFERE